MGAVVPYRSDSQADRARRVVVSPARLHGGRLKNLVAVSCLEKVELPQFRPVLVGPTCLRSDEIAL